MCSDQHGCFLHFPGILLRYFLNHFFRWFQLPLLLLVWFLFLYSTRFVFLL
jgi:hypothetical protein